MEFLPENMIYEIMRALGPDIWAFIRANKRILGIFEKNRATLEKLNVSCIKRKPFGDVSIVFENSLFPGKKLQIINNLCMHAEGNEKLDSFNWKSPKQSYEYITFSENITENDCYHRMTYNVNMRCIFTLGVMKRLENGKWPIHIGWGQFNQKYNRKITYIGNNAEYLYYNNVWKYRPSTYKNIIKHIFKFAEIPELFRQSYMEAVSHLAKEFKLPGS